MDFLVLSALLLLICYGCESKDEGFIDITNDCKNNVKINFFLTHGMGYADGLSIYIGNFNKNCTINLYTNKLENTSQIIVLENLSNLEWSEFNRNTSIKIIDEYKVINLTEQSKHILYVGTTESHKTMVQIYGSSSDTLKITATSARKFRTNEECASSELECKVSNNSFCINADLQCDGNINCGSYGVFDEDSAECHSEIHKRYIIVIITTSVFFIITLIIIAKFCYGCCPETPQKFFKTDHFEDNKLIVSSRFEKPKIPIPEKKKESISASGDTLERIEEKEIRTLFYEKPSKKHLSTNGPVYRNTRVATILLDDMKNMRNAGFVSDSDVVVDYQNRSSEFRKNKSKCKSFI